MVVVLILFFLNLIACSSKTGIKVVERYKVVKVYPKIEPKPECAFVYLPVRFFKKGNNYCIDKNNALNLITNIKEMRECLDEYEKWGKEVELRVFTESNKEGYKGN